VAGDALYIGSCNGIFRQLDPKTGTVRWEANVRGDAPGKYFFHGDVLVTPNLIVTGADVDNTGGAEAGIHAFERATGRQSWLYPTGRGVMGAVIGLGQRVFAQTTSGEVLALNMETGRREWNFLLKGSPWESPAAAGQRVFAGSNAGSLFALNAQTGQVEWQRKLGPSITTSIRSTGSVVYAGTGDGVMHRTSASNGEVLSSLRLDSTLKPGTAPVITRDGVIVLLSDQGADYRALVSLDPSLARVRWRRAAPDRWSTTRIFVLDQTIVLGTASGEVIGYCAADGSPAWSQKLGGTIRAIGGSDQTLYVGTAQGTLYALRPPRLCGAK